MLESQGRRTQFIKQVCHDHCYLSGVPAETTNNVQLRECFAMSGGKCTQCSLKCDYTVHMHITYTTDLVEKEFLSDDAQKKIKEKSDLKSHLGIGKTHQGAQKRKEVHLRLCQLLWYLSQGECHDRLQRLLQRVPLHADQGGGG